MDLNEARKAIDAIDQDIVRLFEQRLAVSEQIAIYKKAHHLAIEQPAREAVVIQKAVDRLDNKAYREDIKALFEAMMTIGKKRQKEIIDS